MSAIEPPKDSETVPMDTGEGTIVDPSEVVMEGATTEKSKEIDKKEAAIPESITTTLETNSEDLLSAEDGEKLSNEIETETDKMSKFDVELESVVENATKGESAAEEKLIHKDVQEEKARENAAKELDHDEEFRAELEMEAAGEPEIDEPEGGTMQEDAVAHSESNFEMDTPLQPKIEDTSNLIKTDPGTEEQMLKTEKPTKSEEVVKTETGNCYCGKERNLNIVELYCATCLRWFHESCISYQLGKLVPFMLNYVFHCKNCSSTGLESFRKNQAQFTQICVTTIANLMQASTKEGPMKQFFSRDKDIMPYIDSHWEYMTTIARRVTQSWHSTVQKTLLKEKGITFVCQEPLPDSVTGDYYVGLMSLDLTTIRPNYEAMIRSGHLKPTDANGANAGIRGRGYKRRVPDQIGGNQRKTRNDLGTPKLPAHGYPLEHPFNKDGYRYILAEPDPHAPYRQEFDESSDWAGKPIPGWLYRKLNPAAVLLALHDRAPQLKVSEDRLAVTGEKGYCMIRATHYVNRGSWYWECTMEEMPESSAARIGFVQSYGNLQAPLGYDKFGYSWRSRKGTVFHESMGKHFADTGYAEGDVLGVLIQLPNIPQATYIPPTFKDKPLVKFKSHLYFEDRDDLQQAIRNLRPLNESRIHLFKNGVYQGVGFTDIYEGNYYPAVSLYKNVNVSVNFGPHFRHPPRDFQFRGMHERAEESIAEQAMADMLYLTENQGRLRLDLP